VRMLNDIKSRALFDNIYVILVLIIIVFKKYVLIIKNHLNCSGNGMVLDFELHGLYKTFNGCLSENTKRTPLQKRKI
jgi:hypothetical protein